MPGIGALQGSTAGMYLKHHGHPVDCAGYAGFLLLLMPMALAEECPGDACEGPVKALRGHGSWANWCARFVCLQRSRISPGTQELRDGY